jgi:AraC-like DNA-binding protein
MTISISAPWCTTGKVRRSKAEPLAHRDTVLLVEGDAECRRIAREQLVTRYRLIEAGDGFEGFESARSVVPSLVLSAVKLSRLDGYQLCAALKSDERTRHVPVVLLAGTDGREERLKALGTGADCCLAKPFDPIELSMHVNNLIERGRVLRECFSRSLMLSPRETRVASADELFLRRVLAAVEAHLDDPTFDVGRLGRTVGLSRSQLHRKIRTLTHEPPTMLIRSIRLRRAAQLLKRRAGSVAEIAYMVGFSSQAYFATCFRRQFDCSPKQYGASRDRARQAITVLGAAKSQLRSA